MTNSGLPSGSMRQEGYGILKYILGVLGNMRCKPNAIRLFLLDLHFALKILNHCNIRNYSGIIILLYIAEISKVPKSQ